MRIDSRDTRNTASDWPQGLANGHLFTHRLVEESKGDELFLFTKNRFLSLNVNRLFSIEYKGLIAVQ